MKYIIGFIVGVVVLGVAGWNMMPGMMLHEMPSPYSVDETVEKISANAKAEGWTVAGIKPLHKAVKKHGGGDIPPVMLINLCQADHAFGILKDDANKRLSVFMPCTISVYEKTNGQTFVAVMNAELLGKMFGGSIARIMGIEVAEQQQKFIAFLKE
ncbi:MAG: DUF302 domain-containing protein [Gammaproteobacteria bacterium]|nr:DUF302 domain-containing protein [Gammaproteobacteria bacterium]